MNAGFSEFLRAGSRDRRDVFLSAAARLGTPEQHIEKDFWVTWALDALFNGLPAGHPRFLFKGGTSLSKAYGLISRFSEDIDITVFREDLGLATSVLELEAMSRKKRQARLDAIKDSCRDYIQNTLAPQFAEIVREAFADAKIKPNDPTIAVDPDDPDGQSLLFWYPTATTARDEYIRPAVKLESGAKSALDPHEEMSIVPYISDEVPRLALRAEHVTTVAAERTFWDKIVILHGVRSWFEKRGVLRGEGQRVSRHYYDVHQILQSELGPRTSADRLLGVDCVTHARMFFNSPDLGLDRAVPGSFLLTPTDSMIDELRRDYGRMAGMIIGEPPEFDRVIASVATLENDLNQ
jgi:Nucleotidyl transferase AbiEii toxin, Type IV TA system